jgi:hypothetical protein
MFESFRCIEETLLTRTMKNQILSLAIDIDTNSRRCATGDWNESTFTQILNSFNNLRCLYFGLSSHYHQRLSFCTGLQHVISTNLLKLHICLYSLTDCLRLLDCRFNQLHTLYVNIWCIVSPHLTNSNEVDYS